MVICRDNSPSLLLLDDLAAIRLERRPIVLVEEFLGFLSKLLRCHSTLEILRHVGQNLLVSHLVVVIEVNFLIDGVELAPDDVVHLCGLPSLI